MEACALGEDQAAAFAVDFDDQNINLLVDHAAKALLRGFSLQVGAPGQADLRSRHKTAQTTHRDDQAALVVANNAAVIAWPGKTSGILPLPRSALHAPACMKERDCRLILRIEDIDRDFLANLEGFQFFLRNLFIFLAGNDTF